MDGDVRDFEIKAVPAMLVDNNPVKVITEVLGDLMENRGLREIDDQNLKVLTYLSCRSAVKAGDKLSQDEALHIIKELNMTKTKYTCPHGRPVKVEIGLKELEKMFKRS